MLSDPKVVLLYACKVECVSTIFTGTPQKTLDGFAKGLRCESHVRARGVVEMCHDETPSAGLGAKQKQVRHADMPVCIVAVVTL